VSLALDRLVHPGRIPLRRLIELMSTAPARILRVPGGTLAAGAAADITVLAPDMKVTVDPAAFRSKSRNTPFGGWNLRGGVAATFVAGKPLYLNEELFRPARA
jgi:dihydroorotase